MHGLFAPWRRAYLAAPKREGGACFFCEAVAHPEEPERLVIWMNEDFVVLLNRYPYNNGHLMVAPRAHIGMPSELSAAMAASLWPSVEQARQLLEEVYRPDGFNLGLNLGAAAGAGVVDHLHFHVVPRWAGDTNFMTSTGEARVLPESLDETRARLRSTWENRPDD